jgi:hypothetical protein
VGHKLFTCLLLNTSRKIFFIYKSCGWKIISNESSSKCNSIIKNSEKNIEINVHFWKINIFNCVCHWKYFKNQLFFFSIWRNINKIWNIEIDVCAMFKVKYGLNRMHFFMFSPQVKLFDGKGIDMHPWGLKI